MRRSLALARRFKQALLVVSILLFARTATAGVLITYSISLTPGPNVTNILFSETAEDFRSLATGHTALGGFTTDVTSLYLFPPFPYESFLMGVVMDLPGDPVTGIPHVVLMMSDAAAVLSEGMEWSTLFPDTDENELINAIIGFYSPVFEESVAASIFIDDFLLGDLSNGVFDPNTEETVPFYFAPGDTFTVMAFSTGQPIGTGQSRVEPFAVVPEPASATLIVIGLCTIGFGLLFRIGLVRGK